MTRPYTILQLALLLIFGGIDTSGLFGQADLSTRVSLEAKNMPLETALKHLEQQTTLHFSYSRDLIPEMKKINGTYKDEPLQNVLTSILRRTDIRFKLIGAQILLIPGDEATNRTRTLLHGYVREQGSGEALIGAVVYDKRSGIGAYTNRFGFYNLELPADSLEIIVSYMGYDKKTSRLKGAGSMQLHWELAISELAMGTVEITSDEFDRWEKATQMSQFRISAMELRKVPALLGEVDVMRTLQMLPGVRAGNEGTAGLYVRGGGPDQNLILLDDVPIYNASHLFGFFSVFNSDAIKSVELTKGGFPARYGGRLSSVVDVRMKDGDLENYHLDAAVGLISANFTAQGPIQKGKTSFMVSGRRSYLDALAVPIQKFTVNRNGGTGSVMGYRFWDLNAKVNHILSDKDRLYLSAYAGRDRMTGRTRYEDLDDPENNYFEQEGGLAWQNLIGSFRWNHLFSERMFVNTALIYSDYKFSLEDELLSVGTGPRDGGTSSSLYLSRIRDVGIKTDFEFRAGRNHNIRWGAALTQHRFRPGSNLRMNSGSFGTDEIVWEAPRIPALEGYAYAEDEIRFHPRISANLGVHASAFQVRGKIWPSLQPRLSGRFQLSERTAIKASYVTMVQNLHLLTNSGIGLPTDLWVPPTESILPQQSWQAAAGVGGSFGPHFEWSVEAYHKQMDNVIAYRSGAVFADTEANWE
ncbi:MAG: TonB-dependent receptor, partial [Bacteroidota bacterium]